MKLSDVKIMRKKIFDKEKKFTVTIRKVMKDVRIVLLSEKRKIL